jgi:hypothetical protein
MIDGVLNRLSSRQQRKFNKNHASPALFCVLAFGGTDDRVSFLDVLQRTYGFRKV